MTIQDILNKKQDALRRHLFDRNIKVTGHQFEAMHVTIQEVDLYGDALEGSSSLEDRVPVELSITYPPEVPIDRFRYVDSANQSERLEIESTGTFFFDILPIEIYSKFEDNIETGDYIIHTAEDEKGNKIIIILQTTELIGNLRRSLTWKKHYGSPFKGTLPPLIKDIVDELLK